MHLLFTLQHMTDWRAFPPAGVVYSVIDSVVCSAFMGPAPEWLGWHHHTHHTSSPASSAGGMWPQVNTHTHTHTHTHIKVWAAGRLRTGAACFSSPVWSSLRVWLSCQTDTSDTVWWDLTGAEHPPKKDAACVSWSEILLLVHWCSTIPTGQSGHSSLSPDHCKQQNANILIFVYFMQNLIWI